MSNKQTEYSLQTLKNLSADTSVSPPIPREGIVGKADDGKYYGIKVNSDGKLAVTDDSLPTDGNNPSYLISKNAAGEVVSVDTIIGSTTYQQTFTRSDMTVDSTLAISANVEL
jgi:hypothetical protein